MAITESVMIWTVSLMCLTSVVTADALLFSTCSRMGREEEIPALRSFLSTISDEYNHNHCAVTMLMSAVDASRFPVVHFFLYETARPVMTASIAAQAAWNAHVFSCLNREFDREILKALLETLNLFCGIPEQQIQALFTVHFYTEPGSPMPDNLHQILANVPQLSGRLRGSSNSHSIAHHLMRLSQPSDHSQSPSSSYPSPVDDEQSDTVDDTLVPLNGDTSGSNVENIPPAMADAVIATRTMQHRPHTNTPTMQNRTPLIRQRSFTDAAPSAPRIQRRRLSPSPPSPPSPSPVRGTPNRPILWTRIQPRPVPPTTFDYHLRDGTQSQQASAFLSALNQLIEAKDPMLRRKLWVKSESSMAIDEGGLSATLMQFVSAELSERLSKSGHLVFSQGNDMGFVPRCLEVDNDQDRLNLRLLGGVIGLIINHRQWTPSMLLSIPLPPVLFRALWWRSSARDVLTAKEVQQTALSSIYQQFCGDRSPSQCSSELQLDVDDLFPHVENAQDLSAEEYLMALVKTTLDAVHSDAFSAILQGFEAVAHPSTTALIGFTAAYRTVIAENIVTMEKLDQNIVFFANSPHCPHCSRVSIKFMHDELRCMTDEERSDFVQMVSGSRGLPLTVDRHSRINIGFAHCNGIEVHTCFRQVTIPWRIFQSRQLLSTELRACMAEATQPSGINRKTLNIS